MTTDADVLPLDRIRDVPLAEIPPAMAARVVRRIVDREALAPPLGVAAFNSAH